ncbi:hypothetical protein [Spirosoma sp.]|uniref:hypothetical protein n=1 Tax=Spirosoma sp. TaxID=1899569 RepID=UPI00261E4C5F|nr:hypothetical protein [Spirosoma sp.]MCX6213754.1 hypothetical protein [Spirosoma sp.]
MPVVITMAMFVIFLVGFLVGTYVIALIAKFIGGALKPTLPSLEAPVRKVVVRRRTIQVGAGDGSRDQNVLPIHILNLRLRQNPGLRWLPQA